MMILCGGLLYTLFERMNLSLVSVRYSKLNRGGVCIADTAG